MREADNLHRNQPKWTTDPPERVKWEWKRVKRSLGRRERREAIDDLQKWNTALRNCFDQQELPSETSPSRTIATLQKQFSLRLCNLTRNHALAIYRALECSWNCHCSIAHRATLDLSWHCDQIQADNRFNLYLSYLPQNCHSHGHTSSERWNKASMWVVEREETTPPSPQPAHTPIRNLCKTIQREHQVSTLEGFLPDPNGSQERLVHLSCTQTAHDSSLKLISLRPLLASGQGLHHLKLTRKQRFGIAAAMAWAVLHLSDSPWLTQTWEMDEVQFFLGNSMYNGQETLDTTPCISHLFHKENAVAEPQGGQSQSAMRNLFQYKQIRNKTLFALGVFLIELGLDKPFEELRQQHAAISTSQTSDDKPLPSDDFGLAIELADDLHLDAGLHYGDAIKRCLRCEFPGRDVTKNFGHESFRQEFFNSVVAPVQMTFNLTNVKLFS